MKSNDTDEKILNDYFEKELQEEMVEVFNDLNEENEDSVDLELKKKNLPKRLNIVKKATGTLFREEIENIVVSEIVNQFYKKMNNMMQFLILPEK